MMVLMLLIGVQSCEFWATRFVFALRPQCAAACCWMSYGTCDTMHAAGFVMTAHFIAALLPQQVQF